MRNLQRIVALLAVAFVALLTMGSAVPRVESHHTIIEDTAGVLYLPQLEAALKEIDFHTPTKLAIYTRRGASGENFNEEVLNFARASHPEWLSADMQKWADGLFVFAVDVQNRKVGTYFGEDRTIPLEQQSTIQDAAKDNFRQAKWTEGIIDGVKKGADLINQPWYLTTGAKVGGSVGLGAALVGSGIFFSIRSRNRRKCAAAIAAGDNNFSSVSLDLTTTELNARTIPDSSSYGSRVLEQFRGFNERYNELASLNSQVHALTKRELARGQAVTLTQQYADNARELDGLDDVIADSNSFLNKFSDWQAAWLRQVRPLENDLASVPSLLSREETANLPAAAALSSFVAQTRLDIQSWSAQLSDNQLTPDAALDLLKESCLALTELLNALASALVDVVAESEQERESMKEKMQDSLYQNRERRDYRYSHDRSSTILGTVLATNTFYSTDSYAASFDVGRQAVLDSRSSSSSFSSGGSSTGYGSSGGSFSGSGSSSSF